MTRFLLGILSLLLIALPITAQDDENSDYRLRDVSVAEYLALIPEIQQQLISEENTYPASTMSRISYMLFHEYDALVHVDFATLATAYEQMYIGETMNYDRDIWGQVLVHSYLNQYMPDLSTTEHLQFADFLITVIPRDFNGDGQDEFLLDVTKGEPTDRADCRYQAEIIDYYIVEQTQNDQYIFVEHPLPVGVTTFGGAFNYGERGIMEFGFEDLNADGINEWIVLLGGETFGGPGMGYTNTGRLYILSWRDGRMVDLARDMSDDNFPYSITHYEETSGMCDGTEPRDVSWEFANVDNDEALEILQHQVYLDNWYCETLETRVLDWDASVDTYIVQSTQENYQHTPINRHCLQRQAEEAMWQGDYSLALQRYEQAVTLPDVLPTYVATLEESSPALDYIRRDFSRLDEYLQLRLALAYYLNERPQEARAQLHLLDDYDFHMTGMREFADVLVTEHESLLHRCIAVYDMFTQTFPEYVLGTVFIGDIPGDVFYQPELIGCDAPLMLTTVAREHDFLPDETPLTFMQSLNLPIARHISADFNLDGADDWLIWLESAIPPLSFVASSTGYDITMENIDPYRRVDTIELITLPDSAGISPTFIDLENFTSNTLSPWWSVYSYGGMGGGGQTCAENTPLAEMIMWRLTDSGWRMILQKFVCVFTVDEAFPENSSTINGGEATFEDFYDEDPSIETYTFTFVWDTDLQRYIDPQAENDRDDPPPYVRPQYSRLSYAYFARDYAYIVTYETPDDVSGDTPLSNQLFRALALEALDRPDEALAQYLALIEANADSVWARLAMLHVAEAP